MLDVLVPLGIWLVLAGVLGVVLGKCIETPDVEE